MVTENRGIAIEPAFHKKHGAPANDEDFGDISTKKLRTPRAKNADDANGKDGNEEAGDVARTSKRQAPNSCAATPKSIPTSWEKASEADRMLVTMKDDGKNWVEIRKKWTEVTGQETASSSLPNRYARIKSNTSLLKEGDVGFTPFISTTSLYLPRSHTYTRQSCL